MRFEYTPLKQNDAKKLFPILIHGNEEEVRDKALRVISYKNLEKRDDLRNEDHKIKSMNADEAYRTGHQGRLRGSPHGEKRDDFRKEDHKTKSMNDDEPFEIHRTGHRGRLLCLLAVEYAQDNETGGFEIQDNIDLQFREARNLQSQKHILIDVIIVSNAHIYASENKHLLFITVRRLCNCFVSVNIQTKACGRLFRIMFYRKRSDKH